MTSYTKCGIGRLTFDARKCTSIPLNFGAPLIQYLSYIHWRSVHEFVLYYIVSEYIVRAHTHTQLRFEFQLKILLQYIYFTTTMQLISTVLFACHQNCFMCALSIDPVKLIVAIMHKVFEWVFAFCENRGRMPNRYIKILLFSLTLSLYSSIALHRL